MVPNNNANGIDLTGKTLTPDKWDERSDKLIRIYRSKLHYISMPLTLIVSIIHLKFGIQYLGQCTIQPMINIYLIVHASITLTVMLLSFIGVIDAHCIYSRNCSVARRLILGVFFSIAFLASFTLIWLAIGSFWIFGAKRNGVQGSDPTITETFCESELFRASFVFIIVNYIIHGIILLVLIFKNPCKNKQPVVNPPVMAMN